MKPHHHYFFLAGVMMIGGALFIIMSFPDILTVAKQHPSVCRFILGLTLVLLAIAMFRRGAQTRATSKTVDTLEEAQQTHSATTSHSAPRAESEAADA